MTDHAKCRNATAPRKRGIAENSARNRLEHACRRCAVVAGERNGEQEIERTSDQSADQDCFEHGSLHHCFLPRSGTRFQPPSTRTTEGNRLQNVVDLHCAPTACLGAWRKAWPATTAA